jgi:hypothetical protein
VLVSAEKLNAASPYLIAPVSEGRHRRLTRNWESPLRAREALILLYPFRPFVDAPHRTEVDDR